MPTSFSDVQLYSRPGGEGLVPEISALCFGNDWGSGIHEADSRGTLENFSREQNYLSLGLVEREAISCDKIYFGLQLLECKWQ